MAQSKLNTLKQPKCEGENSILLYLIENHKNKTSA